MLASLDNRIPNNLNMYIYISQLLSYEEGKKGILVYKLLQSLYRLIPSICVWYNTLTIIIKELSFKVSKYDSSL